MKVCDRLNHQTTSVNCFVSVYIEYNAEQGRSRRWYTMELPETVFVNVWSSFDEPDDLIAKTWFTVFHDTIMVPANLQTSVDIGVLE